MNKRFVILDGSSLMYRAFYALPPLTDSLGEPTNAIFGFSNMLTKLLGELNPDALVIAFDKGKKTFRTERYPEYKGTRDKTPEELLAQIPLLHEFAAAFGVSFIEKERYEADDIIGTLATKAAAAGHDVMVVTGDKDALQLVRPNLRVMLTKKGISELKAYDEEVFREEYGFEPIRLIDLKGLMGDTSDNIPGVPGVGPKTATKLLLEYGTLENVLENIEAISGKKLKERLTENRDQAVLSKELATIELQVPDMELTMDDYAIMPDHAAMKKFCDRYELKGVWKNFIKLYGESDGGLFAGMEIQEAAPVDLSYDEWEEKQAAAALAKAESVAVCGIFTGRVPFEQLSRAVVVTSPAGDTGLIALDSPAGQQLLRFFEADKPATFYELKQYYHAGIKAQSSFFDIKLADYLLHPELSKYELSNLSHQYFPGQSVPESFADEVSQAVWTAKLIAKLQPKLAAELEELGMKKLYDEIELPLVEVLAAMEQNGVYVNRKNLEEKAAEVGKKIEEIQQDIYTLAGTEFNINSPKQLGEVLFERLELPPTKKTKTGYSTNAEVLESLRYQHPIIEQILAYRMWTKLKSTYLDAIGELIHPESGRVHTSFNQTVTATGRLSSSDPNLQNIPVRTEEGKTIRALFEPGEGYDYLLSADYSQIELRLLAHMSGDESFIDAFCQNQDIHARTASEVFGVPLAEVTPTLRSRAKAVNFGIVYGISDYGLSRDLHIPKKEAASYIDSYFARYPGIRKFMDDTVAAAHETGCVTTLYGRRRELPAIKSRNFMQRSLAERMAMNTPIQGTAADIIKLAMIEAYHRLQDAGVKSRILLQVHDELVLETTEKERETVSKILKESMEQVAKLSVPLLIDIHSGKNWAEAK
ncbi:DNA polymerase I [Selenomonas ruminis]|uniref:DNA polymerase I n=1 Tax=Selenomonas ruminis TaxID=2593411 RepID=A0A5D6W8U7_9FIRM|nr:DNA polymerase I [Selenomonas sp. mPRGC5]TYZ24911.1 DNA polymerase I [Selenomonas sp. mPRGC5]